MFMHRVGPLHEKQMASLAKYTKQSFRLIYVFDSTKNAHEAFNVALRQANSRFVVAMDDDLLLLEDGWLEKLVGCLERHDDVAMICPNELKTTEDVTLFQNGLLNPKQPKLIELTWNAGYIMAFDMEKVPDICADENIPGRVRMTDVDLCFQVRRMGYKVCRSYHTSVFHPWKPDDSNWRVENAVETVEELKDIYAAQKDYMKQKWDNMFETDFRQRILSIVEE